MSRRACKVALALALAGAAATPAPADAQDASSEDAIVAVGGRAGLIPPLLFAPEVMLRPCPNLAAGVFGMYTRGAGIGSGGTRTSLGGALLLEFQRGRRDTGYLSMAYDYYHASPNADGFWETLQLGYLTGGYMVKGSHVDLYFGGGLVFVLAQDKAPCTAFCIDVTPPLLPTLELGLHYAFL